MSRFTSIAKRAGIALVLSLFLAACGGGGSQSPSPTQASTSTPAVTISLTQPSNGQQLATSATASVNVTGDVSSVQYVFKNSSGTDFGTTIKAAPWSWAMDLSCLQNGNYTLTATATSSAGSTASTSSVSVSILNPATTIALSAPSTVLPIDGSTESIAMQVHGCVQKPLPSPMASSGGIVPNFNGTDLNSVTVGTQAFTSNLDSSSETASFNLTVNAKDPNGNAVSSSVAVPTKLVQPQISSFSPNTCNQRCSQTMTWKLSNPVATMFVDANNPGTSFKFGSGTQSCAGTNFVDRSTVTANISLFNGVQAIGAYDMPVSNNCKDPNMLSANPPKLFIGPASSLIRLSGSVVLYQQPTQLLVTTAVGSGSSPLSISGNAIDVRDNIVAAADYNGNSITLLTSLNSAPQSFAVPGRPLYLKIDPAYNFRTVWDDSSGTKIAVVSSNGTVVGSTLVTGEVQGAALAGDNLVVLTVANAQSTLLVFDSLANLLFSSGSLLAGANLIEQMPNGSVMIGSGGAYALLSVDLKAQQFGVGYSGQIQAGRIINFGSDSAGNVYASVLSADGKTFMLYGINGTSATQLTTASPGILWGFAVSVDGSGKRTLLTQDPASSNIVATPF